MPSPSAQTFEPTAPTVVTGRVIELRPQGAWIDLVDGFISYDTIVVELSDPAGASGQRVYLQYQDEPTVNGQEIQLGQTVTFTLPVVPGNGCCEPYLEDIADFRVTNGS
jgi:hypothetical protein